MRCAIQQQHHRVLDNGTEDKAWDQRHIGDGVDVPGARCAIMMIAERAVVLVMMDNTDDERHAQIGQAHHRGCHLGIRQAGGNLRGHPKKVKPDHPAQRKAVNEMATDWQNRICRAWFCR